MPCTLEKEEKERDVSLVELLSEKQRNGRSPGRCWRGLGGIVTVYGSVSVLHVLYSILCHRIMVYTYRYLTKPRLQYSNAPLPDSAVYRCATIHGLFGLRRSISRYIRLSIGGIHFYIRSRHVGAP